MKLVKDCETNDSERAKLWDIQDEQIEAHGKKNVGVLLRDFLFLPASEWMCQMSPETLPRWGDCWELGSIYTSRIVVTPTGCQIVGRNRRSMLMSTCCLRLESLAMGKPQLVRGSPLSQQLVQLGSERSEEHLIGSYP